MISLRSVVASVVKSMFGRLFSPQTRGASILMYHSVGENPAFFTVHPKAFAEQLKELAKSGRQVVRFSELIARYERGEPLANLVSITFDDGYLDTIEQALPLLRQYGFSATIFVIPGLMGKTYTTSDGVTLPLFTWEAFRNAKADEVFEVLPHTFTHPELPRLSNEAIEIEVRQSYEAVQKMIGTVPRLLSYPRGKVDARVVDVVRRAGFVAACTVKLGLLTSVTDPFWIPRNPVDSQTSIARLRFFLSNGVYWFSRLW